MKGEGRDFMGSAEALAHNVLCQLVCMYVPYSSKFSRSKTFVIQPAQLLTDNNFRDSLLLQ